MSFQSDVPAVPTLQQDDDIARITRWDFAPGAATGWHSHGWPYFVVPLTEAVLRIHDGEKATDVSGRRAKLHAPRRRCARCHERLCTPDRVRRDRGQADRSHGPTPASIDQEGFVTLPFGEREASAPQELSGRCDCRPPRLHRRGSKRAVRWRRVRWRWTASSK